MGKSRKGSSRSRTGSAAGASTTGSAGKRTGRKSKPKLSSHGDLVLILLAALRTPDRYRQLVSHLEPEMFRGDYLYLYRSISSVYTSERQRSAEIPMRTLRILAKKVCPKQLWEERVSLLTDRWEATAPPDSKVELEVLERFVVQEGLLALAEDIMQKHDFRPQELDPWVVKQSLEKYTAFALVPEDKRLLDFAKGDPSELFRPGDQSGRIPIGIARLDDALDGGLGPGELGIFIGPLGKTAALLGRALKAALSAKRVLHITLEIRTRKAAERVTMEVLGKTKQEIRANPKLIRKAMNLVKKAGGQLLIQDLSHEKVSMQRIEGLIAKYSPLDLVTLDYADLLGRGQRKWKADPRVVVGDTYWELRRQGSAYDVPIWTASQGTRSTIGAEEFGKEDIAEDISKIHTGDVVICIMQTAEEKERGIQRWKLDKSRESAWNPTVTVRYDYERMTLSDVTRGTPTDVTRDTPMGVTKEKAGGTNVGSKARQKGKSRGRRLDPSGKRS